MLRRSIYRAFSTAKPAPPKPEYPTSFLSHLARQPLNAFNVGVTLLTLSLSIQLVNATNLHREEKSRNEKLVARVALLEDRLKEFGVVVLTEEEQAKADEVAEMKKVDLALQEKAKNAPQSKGVMV
ncbi:hypothetical protein AC1031_018690 [Aphanomyces cochlioides]|nr:hypothetical protein AC1031_018690 [Aphanomyces cochlioides]